MFQHQFNFLYNLYVTSRASSCNVQSVNLLSTMLIEGEPLVLQSNISSGTTCTTNYLFNSVYCCITRV